MFYLLCCFAPFFFQSCSFEQDKLIFLLAEKPLVSSLQELIFWISVVRCLKQKSFIVFRFFWVWNTFFSTKILNFLNLAENSPQKLLFQQKMLVQISSSSKHFVFRKISVSPAFSDFFHLLPVSFIVRQSLIRQNWFVEKKNFFYLLLILLHSFSRKNFFLFFNCPLNFLYLCFSVFLLFLFCFSGVFHLFWVFQTKKLLKKKNSFGKFVGFEKLSFELFLLEWTYFDQKSVEKLTFVVSSKILTWKKRNLFPDSHALRIACANEGPLDHCCVSWRSRVSQVCVHSVVIDPGRGTSVASSRLSTFVLFFFAVKNLALNVFL